MQRPQKYRNRLADESSPYLLQHAHNPVDWYPWGAEAFEKAAAADIPILLSIGYSACHWCHVMAHESFEDERIAEIMNERFINIKVDMEERPDVDKIYMNFVQLTTGSGGWPLTAFLTPDQRPFFGGTYFPPTPRFNMPSFEQILISVSDAYRDQRDEVLNSADEIVSEITKIGSTEATTSPLSAEILDHAFGSFVRTFDSVNGGFGGAPKFPAPMALEFLLRYYKRTGNEKALEIVDQTCRKMAEGGIFDQIGGGFHRYAVDSVWLVPHFEKMLYDNAQLIRIYVHLFQITGDDYFRTIAEKTIDYIRREMLDDKGGFYSAQDADSEGVEGKFFVWTREEIEAVIGTEAARVFNRVFDISEAGNFEGKNIPNIKYSIAETATVLGLSVGEAAATIESARAKLFDAREKRIKPFRDDKVIAAWNGLMLAAFSDAAAVFGRSDYLDIAIQNADFLITEMQKDGRLLRSWKDGEARLDAYLEDYANVADGLFELFAASGDVKYLKESNRLVKLMIDKFWDEENGGFFFTGSDHEELLVRSKDFNDNAVPSGNSVAFDVLLKLAKVFGKDEFTRYATTGLRLVVSQIARYPGAFGRTLQSLEFHLGDVREIVIVGVKGNELERLVDSQYLPDTVVYKFEDRPEIDSPLLMGRSMVDGKPTAYVCQNYTCQRPVTTAKELAELLQARRA